MPLEHEELTAKIIGAAIEVHRRLGPGFLESVYEKALILELTKRGLSVQVQMDVAITYDGVEVGQHRLDLFGEMKAGALLQRARTGRAGSALGRVRPTSRGHPAAAGRIGARRRTTP